MTTEQLLSENENKVRLIVLTKEEEAEAYFEGKRKKYFKIKNKPYWDEQEKSWNKNG